MKRLLAALALLLLATPAGAVLKSKAPPAGGGGGTDQLQIALDAATANTWIDLGAAVGTSPTVISVEWPCTVNGACTPSTAQTQSQLTGPSGGFANLMAAWAGGGLDTTNHDFCVWGGGHNSWWGNEVYCFNTNTLLWRRVDAPSDISAWSHTTPVLPDGTPAAYHAYDGVTFLPGTGFFTCGGSDDNGDSSNNCYIFDQTGASPSSFGSWPTRAANPSINVGPVMDIDSASGNVIIAQQSRPFSKWTAGNPGSWSQIGAGNQLPDFHMTGRMQPGSQFVALGGGFFWAADVSSGNVLSTTMTGDTTCEAVSSPALGWDATTTQFIDWCGGKTIYLLNPTTYANTAHTVGGSVTPACTDTQGISQCTSATGTQVNGTFGRGRWDPTHRCLLVVNTVNDHVYAYKPDF